MRCLIRVNLSQISDACMVLEEGSTESEHGYERRLCAMIGSVSDGTESMRQVLTSSSDLCDLIILKQA